jgi:hypothetical protein
VEGVGGPGDPPAARCYTNIAATITNTSNAPTTHSADAEKLQSDMFDSSRSQS